MAGNNVIGYRTAATTSGIGVDVTPATPLPVEVISGDGNVIIEGDAVVDTTVLEALVGALDATKVTDPDAASASTNALLRGILEELQAQTVILGTIATNTTPA